MKKYNIGGVEIALPETANEWALYDKPDSEDAASALTASLIKTFEVFEEMLAASCAMPPAARACLYQLLARAGAAPGCVYVTLTEMSSFGAGDSETQYAADRAMQAYVHARVHGRLPEHDDYE